MRRVHRVITGRDVEANMAVLRFRSAKFKKSALKKAAAAKDLNAVCVLVDAGARDNTGAVFAASNIDIAVHLLDADVVNREAAARHVAAAGNADLARLLAARGQDIYLHQFCRVGCMAAAMALSAEFPELHVAVSSACRITTAQEAEWLLGKWGVTNADAVFSACRTATAARRTLASGAVTQPTIEASLKGVIFENKADWVAVLLPFSRVSVTTLYSYANNTYRWFVTDAAMAAIVAFDRHSLTGIAAPHIMQAANWDVRRVWIGVVVVQ